MSMKNSSDTIGNRNRDLPACSAVPQPAALPRAPVEVYSVGILLMCVGLWAHMEVKGIEARKGEDRRRKERVKR